MDDVISYIALLNYRCNYCYTSIKYSSYIYYKNSIYIVNFICDICKINYQRFFNNTTEISRIYEKTSEQILLND